MTGDAFNAAKAVFTVYGGFFKDTVRECGLEKAIAFHAKQAGAFDGVLAGMITERLGGGRIDLDTFASARSEALSVLGMAVEAERSSSSVKLHVARCPLYEGLQAAGLDHTTIETMCRRGVEVGYALLEKAFPQLSGSLHFRPAHGDPCIEEFSLTEG